MHEAVLSPPTYPSIWLGYRTRYARQDPRFRSRADGQIHNECELSGRADRSSAATWAGGAGHCCVAKHPANEPVIGAPLQSAPIFNPVTMNEYTPLLPTVIAPCNASVSQFAAAMF